MRAQRITVVLANPYFDPRGAQLVAQQTGARIVKMAHQVGRGRGPTIICRWLTTMCVSWSLRCEVMHERCITGGAYLDGHDAILKTNGLAWGYGRRVILNGVTSPYDWASSGFCSVPPGVGKTTFVRTVLDSMRPLAGQLWRHPDLKDRTYVGFGAQRRGSEPDAPDHAAGVCAALAGRYADASEWDRAERRPGARADGG